MLFVMSSRITSSFIKKNPISFWSCKNMTAMGNYCFWVAETLKISSETTNPNVLFVCTNNVCRDVIHRNYSFRMNPVKNMTVMGNPFSDCQKLKKKKVFSELLVQMIFNLIWMLFVRCFANIPHFGLIWQKYGGHVKLLLLIVGHFKNSPLKLQVQLKYCWKWR